MPPKARCIQVGERTQAAIPGAASVFSAVTAPTALAPPPWETHLARGGTAGRGRMVEMVLEGLKNGHGGRGQPEGARALVAVLGEVCQILS